MGFAEFKTWRDTMRCTTATQIELIVFLETLRVIYLYVLSIVLSKN